jgi:hypothetical protein
MEPESSLPCSQGPAPGPYPQPYESSQHPPTLFLLRSILILLPSTSRFSRWFFPLGFPAKILYARARVCVCKGLNEFLRIYFSVIWQN